MLKNLNDRLAMTPIQNWTFSSLEGVAILHALNTYEDEVYLAEHRKDLALPLSGSVWTHRKSGNTYRVIAVFNKDTQDYRKFPPTVAYQGMDGRTWARKIEDWHTSFELDGAAHNE